MLERDYLTEMLEHFVETVSRALLNSVEEIHLDDIETIEREIGEVIDLDGDQALQLAPDSLVTLLVLSGTGDTLSAQMAYALHKLSEMYAAQGDEMTAGLRNLQAEAIEQSFGHEIGSVPREFVDVNNKLSNSPRAVN